MNHLIPEGQWRKSEKSGGTNSNCVEIAATGDVVAVRDSKDKAGPKLFTPQGEWSAFVAFLKNDSTDT